MQPTLLGTTSGPMSRAGLRSTRCPAISNSSPKCRERRRVRFNVSSSEGNQRESGPMVGKCRYRIVAVTGIVMALCAVNFAQQGWTRLQAVKQAGREAAVSAVYYNGDDVWIAG